MALSTARLRRVLLALGPALYPELVPLADFRMLVVGTRTAPQELPIPSGDAPDWHPVAVGSRWGAPDVTVWFHGSARVPEAWLMNLPTPGREPPVSAPSQSGEARYAVALRLLLGRGGEREGFGWPEGLLYVNGRLFQGINRHHQDVLLRDADARAGLLTFDVRAWSGLLPTHHRIEEAEIALLDHDAEALYHLLLAGADLVDALDARDPLSGALRDALAAASDMVDLDSSGQTAGTGERLAARQNPTIPRALAVLRGRLAELRAEHLPSGRPSVVALGHGHLDVAWLWQTRHTREKAARTFGIATALMERYPDYHFLHTTPQVFAWLKSDYPAIYARVRERAREGRFELAGAMWLEPDCNLVSGEALVRQILYGQRYLRAEFGRECDVLWLPDAFGYSAALPQIMLRAGLRTFVTTKLSWSETNRIPYDTFRWRGLDGSEVLAHFITTPNLSSDPRWARMDTYNGSLGVAAVRGVWERYRQKAVNDELVLAFGFGDGGAGPTRQQLEQARAIQALPGAPDLRLGRADEALARIHQRVWEDPELPVWDGELYLEYHRGTYTTQAWLKRAHRRAEADLLLAELLDAWRHAAKSGGVHRSARSNRRADAEVNPPGPTEPLSAKHAEQTLSGADGTDLGDAWRVLLLHEFHDILPGSSIHEVYRDAREAFAQLSTTLDSTIERDLRAIAAMREAPAGSLLVFNPSPWPRPALIALPAHVAPGATWRCVDDAPEAPGMPGISDDDRPALLTQDTASENLSEEPGAPVDATKTLIEVPAVPGLGYRLIAPDSIATGRAAATASSQPASAAADSPGQMARAGDRWLENAAFRLALNAWGEITSLIDKRIPGGREGFLAGQPGNQLLLFDDRPQEFDGWNIDATYERRSVRLGQEPPATISVLEAGPLRATLRVVRVTDGAIVTQDISLYHAIPRIDFATRIDWQARHRLLKAAFPLDLRVTRATFEAQYGAVERPTHRNTSWDQARFEVWAHRWVDLSESDYGVSLLNDGRYGHDVHDSTLRISLARGPTYPDPHADEGAHVVTYSLYPHLGDWRAGGTVAAAYALNRPVRTASPNPLPPVAQLGDGDASPLAGSPPCARGGVAAGIPPLIPAAFSGKAARGVHGVSAAGLFAATPERVVIEAVKRAADGEGLIVRLYEAHGGRCTARVRSALPLAAVAECDLLERPLTPAASPAYAAWRASPAASHDAPQWDERGWACALRPFEVRSFRLRLSGR
jgi:alpha-mannosidase